MHDDDGQIVKWCGVATDVDDFVGGLRRPCGAAEAPDDSQLIVNVGGHSAPFDDLSVIIVRRTAMEHEEPAKIFRQRCEGAPPLSRADRTSKSIASVGAVLASCVGVERSLPLPAMGLAEAKSGVFGPASTDKIDLPVPPQRSTP